MTVNGVRVALVSIVIDAWADMTVGTQVIVNQPVSIAAESSMTVAGFSILTAAVQFDAVAVMSINGIFKWTDEADTPKDWTAVADTPDDWTPVADSSGSWTPISDTSENWSNIADNSETWQIAA